MPTSVGIRAAIVFAVFNVIMLVTVLIMILIAPRIGQELWIQTALAFMVALLEAVIVANTISEPLRRWINGEPRRVLQP